MNKAVFDTSALLAVVNGEEGGDRVANLLLALAGGGLVSAVNLSEAQAVLIHRGTPDKLAWAALSELSVQVVPFDAEQARAAGVLIAQTKEFGLSFGDRACLALGIRESCTIVTADRAWKKLKIGVKVEFIRT